MQSIRARQLTSQLSYDGSAFTTSKPWHFPNLTLIDGFNVSTQITNLNSGQLLTNNTAAALSVTVAGNASNITTNTNRMNTIIDSGTTLDTISELKAAWEGGDSTLNTAITSLTTTASTDRALIRAENATDNAAIIVQYGVADNILGIAFAAADTAAATFNAAARSVVSATFIASDAALQTNIDAADAAITVLEDTVNNTHGALHTAHTDAIALRATAHEPTFTGDITVNSNKLVGHSGTEIQFNQTNLQLNTHASGTLTGTAFGNIAVSMHPKVNQTYDFGLSGKRWREVYTKDIDFTGTFYKNGTAFAKTDIGLPNVDNTADVDKPISTAAATKNSSQDTTIGVNTAKVGFTDDRVTAATAVQANSSKTGFTQNLVDTTPSVVANTAKTGYTDAAVALAPAVAANTAKTGYTDAAVALAPAVAANTAKVGFTDARVTASQSVQNNSAKTGFTEALVDTTPSVVANTAKITFGTGDSTLVTQNKDNITDLQTDIAGLDAVVNTTHANLHTSHTSAIASKVSAADGAHTGDTTFDGNTLAIDSSNSRVGIGKTDPSFMLHMHDAAGNAEFRISRDLSDNHITINSHSFTKIGNGTGNTPYKWRLVTTDPFTWETSNTEWMRLDPNGNLGLGTTSPGFKLDVNGTARISGTVHMPNLPTSDPLVAGQLWKNNANKIVVSEG